MSAAVAQSAGLSLQRNFVWALAGNVVYALCQWGMIIVLAKLTNPFMVGQFSLGLAVATPVLMLTNLQLRMVQATDVRRGYSFGEYLGLRLITTFIGMAAIAIVTCLITKEPKTIMVVLAVAATKAMEAASDIFYGLFQLNNHIDQTGTSMMIRGALSVVALTAGLYFTRDVLWGVIAMAVAWLAVLVGFDASRGIRFMPTAAARSVFERWRILRPQFNLARQWTLTRLTFPLGIVMALVSLNMNMPRYFVHSTMGETELGVFSTMAYAMVAIGMVVDAMTHSAAPRLARFFADGRVKEFRSLLIRLAALGLALGFIAAVAIAFSGTWLLAFLYGKAYAGYDKVFTWLMAGAGLSAVASMLTVGITSAKRFSAQVPMFVLVSAVNLVCCAVLVPSFGMLGAAVAPLVASSVHFLVATGILIAVLSTYSEEERVVRPDPAYSDSWGSGL
jgi:O-antigen/teichoic acid export membrane protein